MAMRLGLFGGSFDPIHRGHVEPVRAAIAQCELDLVLFLPTAQPPHKRDRLLADAWARFAMVELALLREESMAVSPHELTLGKPAYTVETLEHFHRQSPDVELHLLLGEDSYRDLPQWVRAADIVRLARLIVLARPDAPGVDESPALRALVDPSQVEVVRHPVAVSSTEVRATLARGAAPPAGALAAPVVQYIRKYHLYR
jgi:nicotinate-nucleotide adenylyltransferase